MKLFSKSNCPTCDDLRLKGLIPEGIEVYSVEDIDGLSEFVFYQMDKTKPLPALFIEDEEPKRFYGDEVINFFTM